MPIYEYKCLECGYRFEKFQRLNEASPDFCPRCGGPIKKVLSAPAIHFKGSGWYVTDYGRPNPSNSSRSKQEPQEEIRCYGRQKTRKKQNYF